jgi:hypothetical protein
LGLLQQCRPFDFSQVKSRLQEFAYPRFALLDLGFWMFGIGRTPSEESSNERSDSIDESENSGRFQLALMDQNQTVQALQAQLEEIQRNLAAQHEIIVNLSANRQQPQPNP